MPAGVHKAKRTTVGLSAEVDAAWTKLAADIGIPKAALMREVLTSSLPVVKEVQGAVEALKENPQSMDDLMAKVLWAALKQAGKEIQ